MKRSGFHRTDFKLVKEGTCAREDTPQETLGSGPELPAGSSTHSVRTGKPEPQSWKDGRPSRVPFQDFACMETEVQAVISRAAILGEEGLALPEVLETLTGVLGEQSRSRTQSSPRPPRRCQHRQGVLLQKEEFKEFWKMLQLVKNWIKIIFVLLKKIRGKAREI